MIDKAVSELKRRFSDENREIFLAVGALMPGTPKFLNVDLLMPMAQHYKSNEEDFRMAIAQLKRTIQRKTADGTLPSWYRPAIPGVRHSGDQG